ncbi:hypothetical protein [Nocardioides alkalitolerans]|uniref:hypothetical protein n=1 Tax=Nocardioides alkalitolerans TaxID=281714 RepID=UPI0004007334|nr:hypothetical protein [Nocardioides alkalitolerans]
MAKNKRAKGSGTIYQRASDGMWVCLLEQPSEPGARRRKVIARKKNADVVAALRDLRSEFERAGDLPTSQPTVSQ